MTDPKIVKLNPIEYDKSATKKIALCCAAGHYFCSWSVLGEYAVGVISSHKPINEEPLADLSYTESFDVDHTHRRELADGDILVLFCKKTADKKEETTE